MADEKDPRENVRIRHPRILRQGFVARSALQYLDGWYEVEDRPRRRRAPQKTSAAPEASESTTTPAEADANGHTTKSSEEE